MERATDKNLNSEQIKFREQLAQAVEHIISADNLLASNTTSDIASNRAMALLLSAIARIFLIEIAEKHNMGNRLPALKHSK